ncbi:MAG: glycosyltransferase family 4 protein, partial [Curtobacterium sp.]
MTGTPRRADRRLRIGVVTNGLAITGGVERCVLEDTRELVRAGHAVEVWHRGHLPPGPTGAEAGSEPYADLGLPLHRTGDRSFGIRSALVDTARFVRDGLRLRRSRLDVLWLNRPEHLPWGRVASFVSGVPLVVHLHHAPNYRRLGPIAGGRTHYLAVSHTMARAWADVGVPASRITVVPNGVDTALFPAATASAALHARRTLGLDDDSRTVLYYGRLTRSKGVLALLDAWRLVLEQDAERHRSRAPRAAVGALTPALGPGGAADRPPPPPPAGLVPPRAARPDHAPGLRRPRGAHPP